MDVLKFAIEMERDGERYYRKQARDNKDNALAVVFAALADDEKTHAALIEKRLAGLPAEADTAQKTRQNVFDVAEDFKSAIDHKQLDVYRTALEMEEKSVALYKKLLDERPDDRALFSLLIEEEEKHFRVMELLVRLIVRPEEWVESAEFGVREEY